MNISITYQDFVDVVESKKLFVQYYESDTEYFVFAGDGNIEYETNIIKNASTSNVSGVDANQEEENQTHFETNYKEEANRPAALSKSATQSKFIGKQIELTSEETSGYAEWEFADTVYIRQGYTIPINAEWGDYVDLSIHLKSDDTLIKKYGKTIYLYGDKPSQPFLGEGSGQIPNYCKVRCTYHKAAGSERKFIIITEFLV